MLRLNKSTAKQWQFLHTHVVSCSSQVNTDWSVPLPFLRYNELESGDKVETKCLHLKEL